MYCTVIHTQTYTLDAHIDNTHATLYWLHPDSEHEGGLSQCICIHHCHELTKIPEMLACIRITGLCSECYSCESCTIHRCQCAMVRMLHSLMAIVMRCLCSMYAFPAGPQGTVGNMLVHANQQIDSQGIVCPTWFVSRPEIDLVLPELTLHFEEQNLRECQVAVACLLITNDHPKLAGNIAYVHTYIHMHVHTYTLIHILMHATAWVRIHIAHIQTCQERHTQ